VSDNNQPARLTADDIEQIYAAPLPRVRRQIAVKPGTYLIAFPGSDLMTLQSQVIDDAAPDVTAFQNIDYAFVQDSQTGNVWHELTVIAGDDKYPAYQVLAAITELLEGGLKFHEAVPVGLRAFKEIIARRPSLSEEKQVGLYGELLLLEHGLGIDADQTLDAWLGPHEAPHDFVFRTFDAEVKTTRGQSRHHTIGSLTQLEPSPDRPLFMLSIQVTEAGAAQQGRTLARLIADLRKAIPQARSQPFTAKLDRADWDDGDADLYPKTWVLRSAPRAYAIDEMFPALTPPRVAESVPQPNLIDDVRYRVDVTQMDHSHAPDPLGSFVEGGIA
jgi:hypothetical protein